MPRLEIPVGVFCSLLSCVTARCLAQEAPPLTPSTSTAANPTSDQATPNQAGGAADLQKAVQNPVASMISVPIQNNSNSDWLAPAFLRPIAYPSRITS